MTVVSSSLRGFSAVFAEKSTSYITRVPCGVRGEHERSLFPSWKRFRIENKDSVKPLPNDFSSAVCWNCQPCTRAALRDELSMRTACGLSRAGNMRTR
jgi:hypothetical protein